LCGIGFNFGQALAINKVVGSLFQAIGANFEALVTDNLAIFSRYENTTLGKFLSKNITVSPIIQAIINPGN
jgi:hypothetical protein